MIITSKIPPLNSTRNTFPDTFFDLLSSSSKVGIATGYISADSLTELKETLFRNPSLQATHIDLLIGMHYFEGVTSLQLDAIKALNDTLKSEGRGEVRLANRFKFHGKVYCFYKDDTPFSCLIGSSNLNNISSAHSCFEVDALLKEKTVLSQADDLLKNLAAKASISVSDWTEPKTIKLPSPLEEYGFSDKLDDAAIRDVQSKKTEIFFDIPIKAEEKSNLNVFFGKGRKGKNGLLIPRPWYEVELIISKQITRLPDYPKGEFVLVTKDGWKFKCKTSGDYYKNFRSTPDLQILGRWIKGEMENSRVLHSGEMITEKIISSFGRSSFKLTKTTIHNTWFAEL